MPMKKSDEFTVTTGYMIPGLRLQGRVIHEITVHSGSERGGDGTLALDPNVCQINDFGEPEICTLIATLPYTATVTLLKESEGKRLYAIEAKGYRGPALRVVLRPPYAGGHGFVAQLLVLRNDGSVQRIVNLTSMPSA